MLVDATKTYLKNIVLLAREYKEKIPGSDRCELKNIRDAYEGGNRISTYDGEFFNAVQEEKNKIYNQVIFWGENLLPCFTSPMARSFSFKLNQDYISCARKILSSQEFELLTLTIKILTMPERIRSLNRDDEEKLLEKLMDIGMAIDPDNLSYSLKSSA